MVIVTLTRVDHFNQLVGNMQARRNTIGSPLIDLPPKRLVTIANQRILCTDCSKTRLASAR